MQVLESPAWGSVAVSVATRMPFNRGSMVNGIYYGDPMVKRRLRVSVCVLLWAFCVSITSAQNGAAIRGVVRDPEGNPLPRATVELTGGSAVVRTQTSQSGEYVFPSLRPGTYTISVPPDGFTLAPFQQQGVQVAAGQTVRLDVRLQWGGNLGTLGDDQSRF